MAGSNQFQAFAAGTGANTLTPTQWSALTSLLANGFQSGMASSQQVNTVLRQSSFVSAALAQAIADMTGAAVNDDGVIDNFKSQLLAMLQQAPYSSAQDTGTANAYAASYTPAITTLVDGIILRFAAASANTDASTLKVNDLVAKPLLAPGYGSLVGGEITAGGHCVVLYNSSLDSFVLLVSDGMSLGAPPWKRVDNGYVAKPGERIYLNNRVESPSLLLPASPKLGQEVQVMPYPFTKYSSFNLTVNGNGHPIMGINENMSVNEDNVVFSCKYLGSMIGWFLERIGVSGNSYTITPYTAAKYGANAIQTFDARIVRGAPLVMMVHGGGWISGDRANPNFASGAYVQQFPDKYGIGFASIDYTLATVSTPSYPVAVNDVIAAATYFKNTLGVTDIHILGSSAGANLAALAVITRPDLFASFIGYYGAYDLTKTSQFSVEVQADITQFTTDTTAASPTLNASGWSTPAILIHGDADATVNVQQSLDFGAAIGVSPIILSGQDHGFLIFGDPASALPSFGKNVFNFIDKVAEK